MIVVEHDYDAIMTADYVVDIGPGAGVHGGEIVAQGVPNERNNTKLSDWQYISGQKKIYVSKNKTPNNSFFKITKASGNNLKNITLNLPIGLFTVLLEFLGVVNRHSLMTHFIML